MRITADATTSSLHNVRPAGGMWPASAVGVARQRCRCGPREIFKIFQQNSLMEIEKITLYQPPDAETRDWTRDL